MKTLFSRTAFAFISSFLVFSIFALSLVIYFVAMPLTKRAADDLSALIVLTAQIWVELPPGTRPDFERAMLKQHNLSIKLTGDSLPEHKSTHFYIRYLEKALHTRTGKNLSIRIDSNQPEWGWVDLPMGGRVLRVGYLEEQLISKLPITMVLMVLVGILFALISSILLVRHITQPLSRLAEATTRIGKGESGPPLEEAGASELIELAKKFNQMEKQINLLLENRTTLLAGISHDLRTPIARMQLELELLNGDMDHQLIQDLRENLEEMNDIITTTLELSKGFGDQLSESVDIHIILQAVVNDFTTQGAKITLTGDDICTCNLPVIAFKRVLNNLLDNAVRYSEDKPVEIKYNCHDRHVIIQIIDQGPGIPAEMYNQVFQPFTRLESSRSRSSGGSGLGLAIVAQLCQANSWSIELKDSEYGGITALLDIACLDTSG